MQTKITFFQTLVVLILLYQPVSVNLKANDSTVVYRSMVYSLGYSNFRIIDRQATPLIYSAASVPVQIGFQRYTDKRMFSTNLVLTPGLMHTKRFKTREVIYGETDNNGNQNDITIRLHYLPIGQFEINTEYLVKTGAFLDNKIRWYTGGQIQEFMVYSISLAPFASNQLSLNPKTYVQCRLNDKYLFSSSFSFSLFSLISRFPYSRDPLSEKHGYVISLFEKGTEVETINHFQRFDYTFNAQIRLSSRWSTVLSYQFYWYHDSEKMGLKAYNNGIQIQFVRSFKNKTN